MKPEKVIFRKVDLSKFRFLGTDLRKVEFADVDWDMKTGRSRVYDAIEPDPVTEKFDYPLIAQLYKRLRANYEENLNYAQAGDFHIGEMEMYRKGKRDPIDRGIIFSYKLFFKYKWIFFLDSKYSTLDFSLIFKITKLLIILSNLLIIKLIFPEKE